MMKKTKTRHLLILGLILIMISLVFATTFPNITTQKKSTDIPQTISPQFLEKIENCGKINMLNRSHKDYNPKALVDGSLEECVK